MKLMTRLSVFILLIKIISLSPVSGMHNNFSDLLNVGGYIKELGGLQFNRNFSDPAFSNIFHNRLNFRLDVSTNIRFSLEGRNRIIYNEMFKEYPGISDLLAFDDGLVDMSRVWMTEGSWIGHSEIDRFYVDWRMDDWQVRVGRQRINWGINLVSNPNDLFNTYSFFDFDYPERPGADAVRVQYFIDHLSRLQLAVSPAKNKEDMVVAAMLNFNWLNNDWQTLAGYFKNRMALGMGWAASIGGAGFKGEATWFYDIEETAGMTRGNLVAAAGFDYVFSGGTFAVIEFLYNGGYGRITTDAFMITEPLRADNIMFSRYAVTVSARNSFSPVLQGGMSFMVLPDIEAAFVMPSVNYSLLRNLDTEITGQIFLGGRGTIFEEAGSAVYLSLQYSF